MMKLKHPRILSVLRPPQDSKRALIIETEPIFSSLSNILRDYSNLKQVPHAIETYVLEPIEVPFFIYY